MAGRWSRRRAEGKGPLDIVRSFLLCYAQMATTPQAMIHHFSAYLQIDLGDPTLRKYVAESGKGNERLLAELLAEADEAGEIRCKDPGKLARVLLATTTGSLLAWQRSGTKHLACSGH